MNNSMMVLLSLLVLAAPVQGSAAEASAERGQALWQQEQMVKGEARSCTNCHGTDLTQSGQHIRTKKQIDPMAASVSTDRYRDPKKVAKWFKRNCKWTWGRECTAQEKSDILAYLRAQ